MIISQRTQQRDALAQHTRKNRGTEMQTHDQDRVNSALLGASVTEDELAVVENSVATEGDFEDVEFEESPETEHDVTDFESEEADFDEEAEFDETELDEDEEDFDEEAEDEIDFDDSEMDEDEDGEMDMGALEAFASQFEDVDGLSLEQITGATSIQELILLNSQAENATLLIDSNVLITIDLSDFGLFDRFSRIQLTKARIEQFEEPVNIFAPLSRKKGGYLVPAIDDVLGYLSTLAENGSATVILAEDQADEAVEFVEGAISRSVNMLLDDALGIDDEDSRLLMISDEAVEALADSDEEEIDEADYEIEREDQLKAEDLIQVNHFVVSNGTENQPVTAATVYTHIATRFPAVTHAHTMENEKVLSILAQLPKLVEFFKKRNPNLEIRFGFTMESTTATTDTVGREIVNSLMDAGMTAYNFNDVSFSDKVFPLQSDDISAMNTQVGNSVFVFGGDLLFSAPVELVEDTEE